MEHTDVERTYCEWTPQHFAINIGECGIMNFNEITSCQCTLLLSVHRLITLLLKYNALHFSLRKIHWCIFVSLYNLLFFFLWRNSPQWASASSFTRFLDHTQRRNKVGRTPLDEWSARRRDLYLTIHNTHNRQTSIPPVGFFFLKLYCSSFVLQGHFFCICSPYYFTNSNPQSQQASDRRPTP